MLDVAIFTHGEMVARMCDNIYRFLLADEAAVALVSEFLRHVLGF